MQLRAGPASAGRATVRLIVPAFVLAPLLVAPARPQPVPQAEPGAARSTVTTITVRNFAFSPATVHVTVGQRVSWAQRDTAPHDATATAGPVRFASPMLTTGKTWSYTFSKPGTYDYICSIHPYMKATVVVAKAGAAHGTAKAGGQKPSTAAGTPAPAPAAAPVLDVSTAAAASPPDTPLRSLLLVLGIAAAGLLIPRLPGAVRAARR